MVHIKPKRQRHGKHDDAHAPGSGKLGKYGREQRNRLSEQKFNGAVFAFFRPQAHGECRNENDEHVILEIEKREQAAVVDAEEISHIKSAEHGQDGINAQYKISQSRIETGIKFFSVYGENLF